MSEKFELIDAKDLPVTDEEDVTVLCVGADGEMKRRDAGSFGMKASELAELPTTEAEEVDVICVDAEGNLCRKPGASFGGGSGGNQFYFMTRTDDKWIVPTGTYEALKNRITAGDYSFIVVAVRVTNAETQYPTCGFGYAQHVYVEDDQLTCEFGSYGSVLIFPDDTTNEVD